MDNQQQILSKQERLKKMKQMVEDELDKFANYLDRILGGDSTRIEQPRNPKKQTRKGGKFILKQKSAFSRINPND